MEVNEIFSLIGSVGFPIVACVYMFNLIQKQNEAHATEIKAMTEAINELKLAINTLINRFEQ